LQRLAKVLRVELDQTSAESFAACAELSKMRARAQELAPDTGRSHWLDTSKFFRTGGRGEWADSFNQQLTERYEARIAESTKGDRELRTWLHEGRLRGGIELPQ